MIHISMKEENDTWDKYTLAWNTIIGQIACSPRLPDSPLTVHDFKYVIVSSYSGLQHCICGYIRMHNSHYNTRKDIYQ